MLITILIALYAFIMDVTGFRYYVIPLVIIAALLKFVITVDKNKTLAIKRLAVYMLTVVLIIAANLANERVAESRGNTLVACCEKYKQDHGAYPKELVNLVPEYIDDIPHPYLLNQYRFHYSLHEDGRVFLSYTVTTFVTCYYDFEEHTWKTMG